MFSSGLGVRFAAPIVAVAGLLSMSSAANALSIYTVSATGSVGSGTGLQNLAASAKFEVSGTDLKVTLTNTSAGLHSDVLDPSAVLTALFFDIAGATLTPTSALLPSGSTVFFGPDGCPSACGNVGGEWAYQTGISGPGGASKDLSSSGFGLNALNGQANLNGSNLDDPTALDGLNYEILSAGDDTTTGNKVVTGQVNLDKFGNPKSTPVPLIKNAVVFTLGGLGANFNLAGKITNVSFQYGTALTDRNLPVPNPSPVPLPPAMLLLGSALAGMGFLSRRWRTPTAS